VFVSAGATAIAGVMADGWAEAKGMFLAEVGAGPVYKLFGKKNLGTTKFPPMDPSD